MAIAQYYIDIYLRASYQHMLFHIKNTRKTHPLVDSSVLVQAEWNVSFWLIVLKPINICTFYFYCNLFHHNMHTNMYTLAGGSQSDNNQSLDLVSHPGLVCKNRIFFLCPNVARGTVFIFQGLPSLLSSQEERNSISIQQPSSCDGKAKVHLKITEC